MQQTWVQGGLNDGGSDDDVTRSSQAGSLDSAAQDYFANCDSDDSGVARSAFAAPARAMHVDELWGRSSSDELPGPPAAAAAAGISQGMHQMLVDV
jgi:hypothetical protein